MKKSTHKVEVVPVRLEPHPNADALSIVRVFGYSCCVRTADFKDVDLGAYVPPDTLVPVDRPEFAFLADKATYENGTMARIKVAKLRGVVSMGLLLPAQPGWQLGNDFAELLGVRHYEPPEPISTAGGAEKPPPGGYDPKYDVDSWRRFGHVFVPGETVVVTEKIHGASARFTFQDGRMYCGSRTEWKKEEARDLWWKCLARHAWIEEFCRSRPELTLYGEVFGRVQELRYGAGKNDLFFRAFDLWHRVEGRFLNHDEWARLEPLLRVPQIHIGPYDAERIPGFAEGPSLIEGADHVREGCVVKPVVERFHDEIGRVQLKIVGNEYLSRK